MTGPATSAEKRRKRRIASDEAHSWARNLRLKNAYAKIVLSMLSLYVNGDGVCFVAIGDGQTEGLAYDCELAPDTVRKRLVWLEQIGAIVRFAQWIDGAGRRNSDGRGKRTSDEIRLMVDADQDEIEARALGHEVAVVEQETPDSSPLHARGLNEGQDSVSPLIAPCQPSDSGKGLDSSEPEPEALSQSPFSPDGEEASRSKGDEVEKEFEEQFQRFEQNYPIPLDDVLAARRLLSAINHEDREDAIVGALGYRYFVKAEKRRPWNATKFLRQRRWPGYVKLGRDHLPKPPPPRFFVNKDSPEYQGLLVAYAIIGQPAPRPIHSTQHGCEGVFIGHEPNSALASLAKVSEVPVDTAIVEKTKRWYAWTERLGECRCRMPMAITLRKFGEIEKDKNGMVTKLPTIIRGARFPSVWPPPKGAQREKQVA